MGSVKHTTEKALDLLRKLPRVTLGNIRDNPNSKQNVNIKLYARYTENEAPFLLSPVTLNYVNKTYGRINMYPFFTVSRKMSVDRAYSRIVILIFEQSS